MPGIARVLTFFAVVTLWVAAPAAGQTAHWAYVPPVRKPAPPVAATTWCRNEIDRIVSARLEKLDLAPEPETDRPTLLRRLSLDLIGLPPTPEEVARFVQDRSAAAYEYEVDRLLASPRYGERMATPWLDLARYADTNGYEKDLPRSLWPWRDWVIAAFNADMPYDQFTIRQLAGDLLPNATLADRIATGFHRNTMLNDEGGIDAEEFRVVAVVDRVNTTATTWLGSTLACAQCHDHKHDPFSQREYYRFYAFFDHDADTGVGAAPEVKVPTPEVQRELDAAQGKLQELEDALDPKRRDAAQEAWERNQLEPPRRPIDSEISIADANSPAPGFERNDAFSYGGFVRRDPGGCVVGKIDDRDAYRGIDLFVNEGRLEVHVVHHWPEDGIKVETVDLLPAKEWHHVFATYDGQGKAGGIQIWVDGISWPLRIVKDTLTATIQSKVPWKVGARSTTGTFQGQLEQVRVFQRALSRDEIRTVTTTRLARLLANPAWTADPEQARYVRACYVRQSPAFQPLLQKAAAARQTRESLQIPTSMVLEAKPSSRPTRILKRGNFRDLGDSVTPGVPAVFQDLAADLPRNRLGLARWLVALDNPLTARVAVNRTWQLLFGTGLVPTPEDFGTHGDRPTHVDLLDWLATEFVRQGWSTKALIRLMVTSATYRQSSRVSPDKLARDPNNALLSRANRPRLEAEQIRDQALAIAGLLDERIGGPSVMPYQPPGTWAGSFAQHDTPNLKWVEASGRERFRRGLYTYWRRSAPYPASLGFDATRREVCVVERSRSNTPLQALVTLNDPVYREAALGLAARMAKGGGIAYGFRLCTARDPQPRELEELTALHTGAKASFAGRPGAAQQAVECAHVRSEDIDPAVLAPLFVVANVLLNLDEVLTRG